LSLSPHSFIIVLQLSNSLYYSLFLFIVIFLYCVTRFPLKIHILVASIQSKNRVFCWNYSPITTLLLLIFHKIRKQSPVYNLVDILSGAKQVCWMGRVSLKCENASFFFWTPSFQSFTRHSNALDQLTVRVWKAILQDRSEQIVYTTNIIIWYAIVFISVFQNVIHYVLSYSKWIYDDTE